ncbi:MAG: hypothetical protein ACXQTR_05630 [Candidatus Methanospirareceae archaeon]
MSRKGSNRASSAPAKGRRKAGEEDYASTRMMSIFRAVGDGEYKALHLDVVPARKSIFLAAVQGEKGGDSDRIPFKLSVAEALEMAFKLRLAARIVIMEEMGVDNP